MNAIEFTFWFCFASMMIGAVIAIAGFFFPAHDRDHKTLFWLGLRMSQFGCLLSIASAMCFAGWCVLVVFLIALA